MKKLIAVTGVALALMLVFRALVFTVCSVGGDGLAPEFLKGDRLLVNRWSYGLRTGPRGPFPYSRIVKQPVRRGDIVAFNDPADSLSERVLVGRCVALPGDTLRRGNDAFLVPSIAACDTEDCYWIKAVGTKKNKTKEQSERYSGNESHGYGLVAERHIIGRVCLVIFSHCDSLYFWRGYNHERTFLPK